MIRSQPLQPLTNFSSNRALKLSTWRELQRSVRNAIASGYACGSDEQKLSLLRKAQKTSVPQLLEKFWRIQHDSALPNDQQLLESREIRELFS